MANIDVSKEGRLKQARKLTKNGIRAETALRTVNNITLKRLIGDKIDARELSDKIKANSKIVDREKPDSSRHFRTDWMPAENGNPTEYRPFAKLLDPEAEVKILNGGKVNKGVRSVFKREAPLISTTTGKSYSNKQEIYKEAQRDLNKTINKKVRFKGLSNIPTLWHPETNTSVASRGASCQISALTAIDWEKKYGKLPEDLTSEQLNKFAEMSKVHQNAEYNEQYNYANIDRSSHYTEETKKHSGLSGSVPPSHSIHLSKRFTHHIDPIKALTALEDNRTYLADRTNHAYTISKEGNKYTVGTTNAPCWPLSGKIFTKMTNSKIHIDPSMLSEKDNQIFEFLKKHEWDIWENKPDITPRKDKDKFPKQVDPNTTKARN